MDEHAGAAAAVAFVATGISAVLLFLWQNPIYVVPLVVGAVVGVIAYVIDRRTDR